MSLAETIDSQIKADATKVVIEEAPGMELLGYFDSSLNVDAVN
jgi:hypothetical protein